MREIFGMSLGTFASRVAYAALSGALVIIIFYYLPKFLYQGASSLPGLPDSGNFLYYSILIAFISGIQIVFSGTYLGDGAGIFNGVAQIFYLFVLTNGGQIVVGIQSQGLVLSLDFRSILYLMILPSALIIVNSVINATARASMRETKLIERLTI